MKHFLFIAVIFFAVFSTNGQPPDIEAINARLDTIKNPSNYCQFALNSGTKLKRYNQIDASVDLFNKALLTAQDAILPELEIAAMYEISIAIDMSGDTEEEKYKLFSGRPDIQTNRPFFSKTRIFRLCGALFK